MPDAATVRSVTVRLDADVASYIAKMEAAGKATDRAFGGSNGFRNLDTDLKNVSRSSDQTSTALGRMSSSLRKSEQDANRTGTAFQRSGSEIDKYSGRLSLLVTGIAAIGPAAIPITATAIPAVVGLAAGMGALVAAMGTGVLAIHGVGDALKALDAYQLDPTAANLKKLQQAMGGLSPAAREFVHTLDQMEGPLKTLQHAAAQGFLPGADAGLRELLHLFPQIRGFIAGMAGEMGKLSLEGSKSLVHDPAWQAFFAMIRRDGVPVLDAWARATGNVAKGLASLLVAFSGEIGRFDNGLVSSSRKFAAWAAGLSNTQGFQNFIDYIHRMGPEVRDFITALVDALIGVARAMAPWGSTVLPILTGVLNILAAIANSKAGPVLFDAAAALLLFSKAARATSGLGLNAATFAWSAGFKDLAAQVKVATMSLEEMGPAAASAQVFARRGLAKTALGTGLARNAAGLGGTLLLGSGLAGGNNVGSALKTIGGGALLGTAIEPGVGTAIGAAAGGAIALGKALLSSDKATNTQLADWSNLASTINADTGKITAQTKQQVADTLRTSGALTTGQQIGLSPQQLGQAVFGGSPQGYDLVINQIKAKIQSLQQVTSQFKGVGSAGANYTDQDRAAHLQQIKDLQALQKNLESGRASIQDMNRAWRQDQDVLRGASMSLNQYTAAMARQTAGAAGAFDAETKWREALKAAQAQARTNNAGINANTNAANSNRDALAALRDAWNSHRKAVLNNVAAYRQARQSFINTAQAMGVPEAEAKRLADRMLAIPKKIDARVYYDDGGALPKVAALVREMALLHDKTITVSLNRVSAASHIQGPGPGIGTGHGADGTTVPKDSRPYGDRYLYLLAPGEEVISNRHGQADFYRANIKGRVPGLADGGTTGHHRTRPGPYGTVIRDTDHGSIHRLQIALDNLTNHQLRHLSAAVNDLSVNRLKRLDTALGKVESTALSAYDSAKQKRQGYVSSISSGLMPDLFASTSSSGGGSVFSQTNLNPSGLPTPGAVNATLRTTTANAEEFIRLVRILRNKGLSGAALAQIIGSGDINLAREYAALPASALHQYGSLYSSATHAVAQAAALGGNTLVPQIGQLHTDLVAVQQGLKDVQHEIAHKEAEAHKSRQQAAQTAHQNTVHTVQQHAAKGARDAHR